MPRTLRSLALVGLALVAVAGCGLLEPTTRVARPAVLAGTAWRAVSVAGLQPVAGREPTLTFDATRVTGTTGCNHYGGQYRFEDGRLTFGEIGSTAIGCEGAIGRVETAFTQALQAVSSVSVDGTGRLVLDGAGGRLVLEVAARPLATG